MNKAKEEFKEILSKLERSNIPFSQLNKSTVIKNFKFNHHKLVLQPLMFGCVFLLPYFLMMNLNFSENCIIDMPDAIRKILRQPEYCEICVDVYKVDKISSISPTEFLENYVKKVHPVVVTDGAVNWSARSIFNFKFFKEYFHKFEIKKHSDKNCQFFPYHTEFRSLREAFNVSESRALSNEKEKPWYIGWNNCNDEAGRYLRQFYERPYFLSNLTESLALSWIFMGGPGPGAHMWTTSIIHRGKLSYVEENYGS
ncbi:hypothetical protein ABEB36_010962 [Hypothenemus hampei]|uniref:Uncharacterized protein n=1 Tax=Hypothenemus hampei TaxID=57062 RepID=A0ABD1EDN1_HYPHA